MTLVNFSLLFGGLFVAVPIVLHLVMRPRPKQLEFPALRFLQSRREVNQRQLQLRHWILLALRCAAVGLAGLALARPSVASAMMGKWTTLALLGVLTAAAAALLVIAWLQRRGRIVVMGAGTATTILMVAFSVALVGMRGSGRAILRGDREAPVSAVLVFDTSPRTMYRFQNTTRLEAAQNIALWLLTQLPIDSQVAVVDSRPGPAVYAVDQTSGRKAIQRLQTTGIARRLPEVIETAIQLATAGQHPRKEIYVFTDLAEAAWRTDGSNTLKQQLREHADVSLYVVDVGVEQPTNFALGPLRLSAQSLARNNDLTVETELAATGTQGTRVVELYVEEPDVERPVVVDGKPLVPVGKLRDRQEVTVTDQAAQRVVFRLRGLSPGVHQGFVSIRGEDNLAVDDTRYFALEVRNAWPVLVAAPRDVDPLLFTEAIAPYEYRTSERARFACTSVAQADLANQALDAYSVVCLLDPEPLSAPAWEQVSRFVERGGGLAVFLGHHAHAVASFNGDETRRVLGGKLGRTWRAGGGDLFLDPKDYEHPILAVFRPLATSVPWNQLPVFQHWSLDELAPGTRVVAAFGNGRPALLENSLGKGRVLTMTTPVTDPARPAGRSPWNELPTAEEPWPYVVLVNEMMLYLAGSGETQLNYLAGETAALPSDAEKDPTRYQLFTPMEEPQEVTAHEGRVLVKFTERQGPYRLKGYRGGAVVRGFAVNLPPEVSQLTRVQVNRLAECLGEDRFQLARNREGILRGVGEQRIGREFYPHLIAALALALALEWLLANRFYRKQEASRASVRGGGDGGKTKRASAPEAA